MSYPGKHRAFLAPLEKINKSSTYDLCITDKAKETSSCADLFRCGAASVCLDCRMFALRLGASVSLIRLPRCYYYTTCKWCMVSHLSSDAGVLLALVPWLPCGLGLCRGLVYRPLISPCYMGLFCGLVFRALYGPLKKRFIFAWFFGYVFPGFFRALFSP